MLVCASCGHENSEEAKFCEECGFSFAVSVAGAKEQRKTVTVLFCDLTGSTALGETLDPERLRAVLARYFGRMKAILESHGASVEKFIGDAVMAVFGVPQVHEDDALRACRAAVEMRDALPELGLSARIGLNTGEVVAGTEERLATGDAVNVAARLEQAAQSGQILIGEETVALVRDAVEAEPVPPLELKGKAEPVRAHRLIAVRDVPERAHDTPFVGRGRELESLRDEWRLAHDARSCRLVTVVGDAGVGKSRLAAEFLASAGATVVRGRCLSYGEGITYWPVVEVVKQLDALPSDPAAAAAIRSLLGETNAATSAEEIAWAFRKLLEEQAPLVVLFDDVQWGEETFFDLVEHVALLSIGAPIMLLFMARPELLDRRPSWSMTVRLEPLGNEDVNRLVGARVPEELRAKIADAAGGNPLFIGEMLAMAEEAGAEVVVPPTLRALLAARLDQLDIAERRVLERGAVEGEIFHRGAVQALAPEETQVTPRLAALVRRELIRPDKAQFAGEDGFRFRHLLIRDAAYDALPKSTRAELHERFAAWLDERAADLVELDEIAGHHLEQAARYKRELDVDDAALAQRAGQRLGKAGLRAFWRSDWPAAITLLERALELLRPLRSDVELELALARAYGWRMDERRAAAIAEAAAERALAAGDEPGEAVARVVAAESRCLTASRPDFDALEALARGAIPLLERSNDHAGLVHAWGAIASLDMLRGRNDERTQAIEQQLRHSDLAGQPRSNLFGLDSALVGGAMPADEALRTLDALLPDSPAPGVLLNRARLLAMLGRFDEAWDLARTAGERLRELSGDDRPELIYADIAVLEGDHARAAQFLRNRCAAFEQQGLWAFLSTYAPLLGRSLLELGEYDEAESLAQRGRELGDEQDVTTQGIWRLVQARVLAHRGDHADAQQLAREAVAITETTDALWIQGDMLWGLAEVLACAGQIPEAVAALEQGLERYARKKNLAMAAQVRERLGELQDAAPR